jgi:hypothetical protein
VVTPGQGPVGSTVTVTGHGFSVSTPIASLVFDGVSITSCVIGSLTTGTIAPGGFNCTFSVPSGTSGTAVTATDAGGASAVATFLVSTGGGSTTGVAAASYAEQIELLGVARVVGSCPN